MFFNFFNFIASFINFLFLVRQEVIGTRIFFSLFLGLYQPVLALKKAILMFLNFLNFFTIFLEFSITGRVGTDRNIFFFSLSRPPPTRFGMKRSHNGVFQFFEFFCYFFFNFLLRVVQKRNETIIFIFSLSQPFPNYFCLK